jgi:thiamine-phosphate pyrophosphorylase
VAAACAEPIDYIAFGPVFGTRTKSSTTEPRGLIQLAEVVRCAHPRPVIAIGGIGLENTAAVVATGAAGVAVISAVAGAADPASAARALGQILNCHPAP